MTEQILKDYFEGIVSVDTLATDLKGSQVKTGYDTTSVRIADIKDNSEFNVTPQHLLKLCNDTLAGHLTTTDLNTVSFALMASDCFHWNNETEEGEIVAATLFDWDNREINYPLTVENLLLWKIYLETGAYELDKAKQKTKE